MIPPMRTGQFVSVLAVLGVAACVETATIPCGDELRCPADMSCRVLTDPEPDKTLCVTTNQLAACGEKADYSECELVEGTTVLPGTCFSGACFPAACGDGIVDFTEKCDIGDREGGTGVLRTACRARCAATG